MMIKRKNIIILFSLLLLASFTVSFSHTIIEQIGKNCANHEDHDFSKVISNTIVSHHTSTDDIPKSGDFHSFNFTAEYSDVILNGINFKTYYIDPPFLRSDQIYLKISSSLLI